MDEVYGNEVHDPHRRQRTQRFAPGGQPEAASKSARGVATRRELPLRPNCGDRMTPGTQLPSAGVIARRWQSVGSNNSPKIAGDGTPKFCGEQDGLSAEWTLGSCSTPGSRILVVGGSIRFSKISSGVRLSTTIARVGPKRPLEDIIQARNLPRVARYDYQEEMLGRIISAALRGGEIEHKIVEFKLTDRGFGGTREQLGQESTDNTCTVTGSHLSIIGPAQRRIGSETPFIQKVGGFQTPSRGLKTMELKLMFL
ncbi:hypothetical protein B0H13DRAFT_1872115 [Mycena leptocephala]|nr:hypothetical protein B0H13DRAFT_1872115 [Mycena leptocephala]